MATGIVCGLTKCNEKREVGESCELQYEMSECAHKLVTPGEAGVPGAFVREFLIGFIK